jgi:gluconate 2-dehydrogenase gamma chain
MFFNGDEGRAIEALADCIIPADPHTPGGKDSGSVVFIDRQLAGPTAVGMASMSALPS